MYNIYHSGPKLVEKKKKKWKSFERGAHTTLWKKNCTRLKVSAVLYD